jgi:hypothetical protein
MKVPLLWTAWVWVGCAAAALAQTGDALSGRVTAVETKGKVAKLTVSTDMGELAIELTPKVELEIVSRGDETCLAPGLFARVEAIESNKQFFGSTFTLYPDHQGRVPPANAVKAPREPGQSQNRYFLAGEIAEFESKPDEKYDQLALKGTGRNSLPLYVERNRTIRVVQTDPAKIEVGQSVSLWGRKAGNRFLATKVTVDTGATVKGDELRPLESKKK